MTPRGIEVNCTQLRMWLRMQNVTTQMEKFTMISQFLLLSRRFVSPQNPPWLYTNQLISSMTSSVSAIILSFSEKPFSKQACTSYEREVKYSRNRDVIMVINSAATQICWSLFLWCHCSNIILPWVPINWYESPQSIYFASSSENY